MSSDPIISPDATAAATMERIEHDGRLFAFILRYGGLMPGVRFVTANENALQLGLMSHPAGKIIAAHIHTPLVRQITGTQEVLILRAGRLRVDFYDDNRTYLESRFLAAGDMILLVSGGHGFEVLEAVEMVEVKTGPYIADKDKDRFVAPPPVISTGRTQA